VQLSIEVCFNWANYIFYEFSRRLQKSTVVTVKIPNHWLLRARSTIHRSVRVRNTG